jgi:hypothetical protein
MVGQQRAAMRAQQFKLDLIDRSAVRSLATFFKSLKKSPLGASCRSRSLPKAIASELG